MAKTKINTNIFMLIIFRQTFFVCKDLVISHLAIAGVFHYMLP